MARRASYYHPLQDIRAVLGETEGRGRPITQDRLGELLPEDDRPLSAATIKAIESGVNGLRPELAARVTALTGVDTRPMLKGDLSKPKTIDGMPFSSETLLQWQGKEFNDEEVKRLLHALSGGVEDVLEELAREPDRLRLAYCLLSETLGSITQSLSSSTRDVAFPELEELHDVIDPGHSAPRNDTWEQVIRNLASKPAPGRKRKSAAGKSAVNR